MNFSLFNNLLTTTRAAIQFLVIHMFYVLFAMRSFTLIFSTSLVATSHFTFLPQLMTKWFFQLTDLLHFYANIRELAIRDLGKDLLFLRRTIQFEFASRMLDDFKHVGMYCLQHDLFTSAFIPEEVKRKRSFSIFSPSNRRYQLIRFQVLCTKLLTSRSRVNLTIHTM